MPNSRLFSGKTDIVYRNPQWCTNTNPNPNANASPLNLEEGDGVLNMGNVLDKVMFKPPPLSLLGKEHFWLMTRTGNRLPALFMQRHKPIGTFLISHGNAEDLGMIAGWFQDFSVKANVNVLAYDYTGYGKASGTASEENCYSDIDAAYEYLTEQQKIPSHSIILFGRSLGSGPSCYLAERLSMEGVRLAGLVLQSPMCSVYRVLFNFRFTLPGDAFPNIDRMPRIKCPVFIIHGTRDDIVPFRNGERLFFATGMKWREKPWWIDGCMYPPYSRCMYTVMASILRRTCANPPSASGSHNDLSMFAGEELLDKLHIFAQKVISDQQWARVY